VRLAVGAKVGTGLVPVIAIGGIADIPTTTQLAAGYWGIRYKDATHMTIFYNNAGAILTGDITVA